MKNPIFKAKYSSLKRTTFNKIGTGEFKGKFFPMKVKTMKKFREVKGENEDVLQVGEADKEFSIQIRSRDKQCVNCGSMMFLGCSHFFPRGIYATRFDEDNGDALCQLCHEVWEYAKNGIYKAFKIQQLGEEGFKALEERSKQHVTPYEAISEFMKSSATLQGKDIMY